MRKSAQTNSNKIQTEKFHIFFREVAILSFTTTYFFVQMFDKPGFFLQEKRVKVIFPWPENTCWLPSHSQYNDKTHEAPGSDTPREPRAAVLVAAILRYISSLVILGTFVIKLDDG